MGRIIPESKGGVLKLDIIATNKDGKPITVGMEVSIDRLLKLTMIPELYINKTSRKDKEYTPIDYNNRGDIYRIKDQTYLGTVSSLITDNLVDVYMIKRNYTENNIEHTEQFILVIPSLTLLDSVDNMELIERPVRLSGMVSLLRVTNNNDNVGAGYILTKDRHDLTMESYIEDEVITTKENLSMLGISLGGLSEHDSVVTSIEANNSDGNGVLRSGKIGMTQFLILGQVEDMFTSLPKELDIARLRATAVDKYSISDTSFIKVNKGRVGLMLDI